MIELNPEEIEMMQNEANYEHERARELERLEEQVKRHELKLQYETLKAEYNNVIRDREGDLIEKFIRMMRGRRISEQTYNIMRDQLEHCRDHNFMKQKALSMLEEESKKLRVEQYLQQFAKHFEEKEEPFIDEKEMEI